MSGGCPFIYTSVWRASSNELRWGIVCLINRFRTSHGLPALWGDNRLNSAAQGHSNSMVASDYFDHGDPGARLLAAGFDWGAYGEAISTGYRTAWRAFWSWLRSPPHCQILLSPTYRFIGIGVNPRGIRGMTNGSGTWTADVALPLAWSSPSGNWGPSSGCPY